MQESSWLLWKPDAPHFLGCGYCLWAESLSLLTSRVNLRGACQLTWRLTWCQVAERVSGQARPTFRSVAAQLVREEGLHGFARGLMPRIANTAL